ncbi:MAG: hypothetical protein PHH77_05255 [Victivallaceae bacterium]|nr:hypothetical protein [Victivallaceae bacterium]
MVTDVTGRRLAELIGISAQELSKARRQGMTFPYIVRAFKQHFPELKIEGDTSPPGDTSASG